MAAAENVVVKRALVVVAILSLGLWWVEIDEAFGLPAHPLLLHVPVVFVPILALAALALAAGKLDAPQADPRGVLDPHPDRGVPHGRSGRGAPS